MSRGTNHFKIYARLSHSLTLSPSFSSSSSSCSLLLQPPSKFEPLLILNLLQPPSKSPTSSALILNLTLPFSSSKSEPKTPPSSLLLDTTSTTTLFPSLHSFSDQNRSPNHRGTRWRLADDGPSRACAQPPTITASSPPPGRTREEPIEYDHVTCGGIFFGGGGGSLTDATDLDEEALELRMRQRRKRSGRGGR